MDTLTAIASWSGGKDSCLACYKAIKKGHRITTLLNFISTESKRCCFHGIEADLISLQAELIGIPLVQKEVTPDMQEYEKEFKAAVRGINPFDFPRAPSPGFTLRVGHSAELSRSHTERRLYISRRKRRGLRAAERTKNINAMVFGDIYLDEHKDWVERVCRDLGIRAIEPLWNNQARALVEEFIDLGFKAVVVSCQADRLGKEFVGRTVDKKFVAELIARNICPCGENGEFHTLVIDGPLFKKGIKIIESAPVLKEGFWKYWFLDIKKYQ